MYINKTTNQNYQLTTNDVNANYRSPPINIPRSTNRSNRLYIHNPLKRNRDRFINVNLSNSIESENNTISAIIESPPQKVGSSTFYVGSESESSEAVSSIDLPSPLSKNRVRNFNGVDYQIQFDDNPNYPSFDKEHIPQKVGSSTFYVGSESSEAFSSIPTESSNYSDDDHIYETIDLPSPLSKNRVRNFNGVDYQIQFDDNPYYFSFDEENVPPKVPPKKSEMFLNDNPCYETIEATIPYIRERLRDHTEFREKYCKI